MAIHGLFNIGNSCYFNSTLQCLINNDQFMDFIRRVIDVLRGKSSENLNRYNLLNFLTDMLEMNNPVNLKHLLGQYNSIFRNNHQQDAHESLLILLDIIHEESKNVKLGLPKPYGRAADETESEHLDIIGQGIKEWKRYIDVFGYSFITHLFSGQFISTIVCSQCSHNNYSFEIFNNISLDIVSTSRLSIREFFIEYFKGEHIEGVECTSCKNHTKHSKKVSVWSFPRIFIIHLKRFDNYGKKNNSEVEISESISFNISKQLHKRHDGIVKLMNYRLAYIVCHEGSSITSGHYTTIVTEEATLTHGQSTTDSWTLIDDESIKRINKFSISRTAYMLIYEAY